MKATWKDTILAESSNTIVIEGNHYFPASSLQRQYFQPSQTTTTCSWKGLASYYTIDVDGAKNTDAAWYYAAPKTAAGEIANYVAFWKGVSVS